MAKIIEYKLLKQYEMTGMQEEVAKLLDEGWQPQGGIALGVTYFYQAMVKYEEAQTVPPVVVESNKSIEKALEGMGVYQSEEDRRAYLRNLGR